MKRIYTLLLTGLLMFGCADMDIPPPNQITDEDLLTSESGLKVYFARMYSRMPFEDFKYTAQWGLRYDSWLGATGIEGTGEALNRDGIATSFRGEDTPYWGDAFILIRDANYLIKNLADYKDGLGEVAYNHAMGEAYFARALAFTQMAKRFGGVPLVTELIEYSTEPGAMEVPRSSEEQTWDQILSDYNSAIEFLPPTTTVRGYATRFVAAAYKSDAMLYAGSVAKYNETVPGRLTGFGLKTGVRVIGFDEATAAQASVKYFREAYSAARLVMTQGGFALYKNKWSATDRTAQYQNMVDMFSDLTSSENIYVKEYVYPTFTHGYDAYSAPFIFKAPLASGTCPTLDFLELFDGFDRYADGTVKVTTGATNTSGEYIMYDKPMDFFANAEPRLRAYVIFPGDVFKGKEIEVRAGTYTGTTPIAPFFNDYSYAAAETRYQNNALYTNTSNKQLFLSSREASGQEKVPFNGGTINAAGENGPFYDNGEGNLSGLYGRKWLNPDPSFVAGEGRSQQPFVLMRYAEVMLNAAEAAVELSLAGEASPDGEDLLTLATANVNAIRERAGAELFVGTLTSDEAGRNVVRKERRKELAFEHKSKWDIRRWRVQHYENREGFWGETRNKDMYSATSRYRFRGLYPFFSTQANKWFFDARFQWVSLKTFEYNIIDYYFAIPGGEVSKSLVIDQQPNR